MKTLLVLLLVPFYNSYGKKADLSAFNEKMNINIEEVIKDNPQLYEKNNSKRSGRMPASVTPDKFRSIDKLDQIEEQADTHNSW